MKKLVAAAVLLLILPTLTLAQKTDPQDAWQGYAFLGAGTGARECFPCGTIWHGGFGGEGFLYSGLGMGAEAGFFHSGPSYNYSKTEGFIVSGDFSYHFRRRAQHGQVDPFVLIGPSAYFPTSHGRGALVGNFGGGANVWLARHAALRLEIRDYVNPRENGWPGPNSVSFRFGVTFR